MYLYLVKGVGNDVRGSGYVMARESLHGVSLGGHIQGGLQITAPSVPCYRLYVIQSDSTNSRPITP